MGAEVRARRQSEASEPPRAVAGAAGPAEDLDPVIHQPTRLAIVSALAVHPELTFQDLKELVDTTDGNLSVHARRLEEAGYLTMSKSFAGRKPRTAYRLTPAGRRALARYIDHMEALIRSIKSG